MHEDKGNTGKKVSTSELMDWFNVLQHYPEDDIFKKLQEELLYPGVLLKNWEDYRRYAQSEDSET